MPANTPLSIGTILAERYRIVKPLGQGDFGAMYKAWDTRLNNPCALKENLETSPAAEQQFAQQTAQLAGLRHPNLPVMIDHFTIPGQGQYLVMDFVPGEDLRTMLEKAAGPLDEAVVLPWIGQVCEALSYLHEHTPPIIHRDVKPSNIRITPDGNAVLVDFGVNKIFDITLKATMGAQAVTAGFSPPELYGHDSADARSDVYALGATLYALLTGQTPVESVQRAIGIDLPAPRSLNPRLSPQTEAAILKAMALLPAERYQSAADFLADLPTPQAVTLHTDDLPRTVLTPPVASHPPAMHQASKRGLPAWVVWIGAAIFVLAALAVGDYFIRQQRQEQVLSATQLALAQVPRTQPLTLSHTPLPSLTPTTAPPALTPTFTPTTSPSATYTPSPTLTPELPLLQGTSLPQGRAAISVDNLTGLQLLARWGSGTIKEIAWSPDGNWLAAGGSIGVHVYDSHSLEVVNFIETDYGANSVAFSPDGSLLAAGMEDHSIRLWQTTDWSPLRTITGHTGPVLSIAFAPDGSMLASGSQDYTIRLWRIPDGTLVRSFTQPTEPVIRVQYSPDGNTLATITGDRLARLWSVASGTYLRTLANGTNSVSFSPDSTLLATGRTYGGIEVWGVEDGASIQAQSAGDGDMLVTFSPNGTTLASASWFGLLSLGSITGATSTSSWYGHADAVSSLAFSPDGTRLASAAMDGSLKLWQVSDQTLLGSVEGHSSNLTSLALTRDGAYMAAGFERGTIQIRFPTNGAIWQTWMDPAAQNMVIFDLEYSPTGTTLVSVSAFHDGDYQYFYGGEGRFWDPANGTMLGSLSQYGISTAFSPNGQALMFGNYLFSPDGDLLDQLETHTNWGEPRSMEISPDGSILAVGYSLNDVRLFRTSDLELLRTLNHATQDRYYTEVGCVAFSPDGTILASGTEDQTIRLWRVSDRTLLRVLTGHTGNITNLAFSPDGTMLVSSSADRTIHLWRVGDGALLHTLSGHTFQVVDVAFSPDSTLIYSASLDGTVRVWGLFVSWQQDR